VVEIDRFVRRAIGHHASNGDTRMNNLKPVDLQDPRIKSGQSPARIGKKIAICSLVVLIVTIMVVWFAFLGWGAIEILRSLAVGVQKLWTALYSFAISTSLENT
jgi:hypothetical protein